MEVFIGMIMPVGFGYVPDGWMPCEGQLLQIRQYQTLYTLLGTTYGGDGITTFALPDLRGRAPVGTTLATDPSKVPLVLKPGQTTGALAVQGTVKGTTNISIDQPNLPAHTHQVRIPGSALKATSTMHVSAAAGQPMPANGSLLGSSGSGAGLANIYAANVTPDVTLAPASVTTALDNVNVTSESTGVATPVKIAANVGGAAMIGVMQPSIGITFLIAVTGIFPSRPD